MRDFRRDQVQEFIRNRLLEQLEADRRRERGYLVVMVLAWAAAVAFVAWAAYSG